MSPEERILADLKQAMLSQDSMATSVLRMLKSELTYAKIAQRGALSEDAVIQTVRREVKKRNDATVAFRSSGHEERAAQEEQEAAVLNKYLPAQADPQIIEKFARDYVKTLPSPSAKDRGEVIKATMAHFGNTAEGKLVSQIVSGLLA